MTIAGRFAAALDKEDAPPLSGPELLPVRLARACVRTLGVNGAGLSLVDPAQQPVPLGASPEAADTAERLQFTVGDGPCISAQKTHEPVFAVEDVLRQRWPLYADLLLGATPYRAVVALPLAPALVGTGSIDLYFERSEAVLALDVFEALAVGELVTSVLSDAAVSSSWSPDEGPEWLQGPAPQRRAVVWRAMGKASVTLGIGAAAALSLLRAHAYGTGTSVDDVAADLLADRLRPEELGPPDA